MINQERMDRLVDAMKKSNVETVLVVPSEELGFYAGHIPLLCERFQGLFVKADGDCFYFCNKLTESEAAEMVGRERTFVWHDNEVMTEKLENVLKQYDLLGTTIAVNGKARAFNILDIAGAINVKFSNGKALLESVCLKKNELEVQLMKKAAEITDEVIGEVISRIRPGLTEGEIIQWVNEGFEAKGAVPDFAIVARGEHTANPHYVGTAGVVQENDIVLLDIGCKYHSLCSDMTRTVFVGEPSEKMKEVYALVLEANLAGESAAQDGIEVDAVDQAGRAVIESGGYGPFFTTRIGHGIGYSTHEAPYIKQSSGQILEPGMAFSVEPGIYLEDEFGVRIEDIVIITDRGAEVINQYPKEMIII